MRNTLSILNHAHQRLLWLSVCILMLKLILEPVNVLNSSQLYKLFNQEMDHLVEVVTQSKKKYKNSCIELLMKPNLIATSLILRILQASLEKIPEVLTKTPSSKNVNT
jgi:hypothetical protein